MVFQKWTRLPGVFAEDATSQLIWRKHAIWTTWISGSREIKRRIVLPYYELQFLIPSGSRYLEYFQKIPKLLLLRAIQKCWRWQQLASPISVHPLLCSRFVTSEYPAPQDSCPTEINSELNFPAYDTPMKRNLRVSWCQLWSNCAYPCLQFLYGARAHTRKRGIDGEASPT